MGGSSTVPLHLHDGSQIHVFRIEGIEKEYVLIQAYPLDGSDSELHRDEEGVGLATGPRLCIGYETIAFVEVTREVPKGKVGFDAERSVTG